uniref:Myotubularin phosphatase domain-containing protein n=1 Tax=Steinernema glaseri TaxID=37863 RepID=A0A1I8A613_9BILA
GPGWKTVIHGYSVPILALNSLFSDLLPISSWCHAHGAVSYQLPTCCPHLWLFNFETRRDVSNAQLDVLQAFCKSSTGGWAICTNSSVINRSRGARETWTLPDNGTHSVRLIGVIGSQRRAK